jgi:general secretion pathway protein B
MSFILDALKKSEHERQRQSMPGLVESTVVRPRQRLPAWAIALCVLLAINLLVLMVVLLRGWMAPATPPLARSAQNGASAGPRAAAPTEAGADPPDQAADLPGSAAALQPAGPADRHFSPLDASPVYAPEVPVTTPIAPPAVPARAAGGSGEHAVRRRDPLLSDDNYKPNEDEVLPSVNELNLTGAQALPELHLDVHVFATRASDRFVFINMRKYHEGATMQEGPTVERIRRDGVILDYQGLRFLLPRQ